MEHCFARAFGGSAPGCFGFVGQVRACLFHSVWLVMACGTGHCCLCGMQQGHGVRRDYDYSALSGSLAMLAAVLLCYRKPANYAAAVMAVLRAVR